ncbi:Asp23/Gls24 family envelope stress response protein [Haloechinothrix sp. LS1_15]|uniref:Asp23/Gls24 family envelope stress response protein n=1 Tax=Haloechinothrix sp. LS1_15 TaxID=2652248 RepID=UPI00294ADCC5|nr:Asp23/Gls24 family envelope stress response protein [Haloechinothrix sp. LS1_15]
MAQDGESRNAATTTKAVPKQQKAQLNEDDSTGKTTIASAVVQKIAGISTQEVSGVYQLGGDVARTIGAIRERIPGSGTASTSGVSVEVGEKQAAIDLDVVVEYGARIVDVARAIRRNVITNIEQLTGLEVMEVNIEVNDVHIPGEEEETTSRVE